ncbi:MAG: VWA domain-containing protein, partial [bacterium]
GSNAFQAAMLTYPGQNGEDGYFTATIYPSTQGEEQAIPKDVVLVLDTSRSMEDDNKFAQAQGALEFVIDHLGPNDRVSLVDYDDIVKDAWEGLRPASAETRSQAHSYVHTLVADGGTNIHDALKHAGDILRANGTSERPSYLLFFTDGLPTVGETDPQRIQDTVASSLPTTTRLFSFGVGYDVNTMLLDNLARDHKGASDYVEPNQSIEGVVSAFYQKIQHPALTDITIDWGGLDVWGLQPARLPDLFHGTQVQLSGRYRGTAPANLSLTISGAQRGSLRTVPLSVESKPDRANNFIPRVWANMRVGSLMSELQSQGGSNEELINEIRSLAMRYGIVTPYTSYLVREDLRFDVHAQGQMLEQRAMDAPVTGEAAVANSKSANARQDATNAAGFGGGSAGAAREELNADDKVAFDQYEAAKAAPAPAPEPGNASSANGLPQQMINNVGNLTFMQAGIGMVDSRYDPTAPVQVIQVAAFSDRYLKLLSDYPALGSLLAQSSEVTVMIAPGVALQTVLLDGDGNVTATSQVNALHQQTGSQAAEGYRSATDSDWRVLNESLRNGWFEG